MKAISLHQPFASLIAYGFKTLETRRWETQHRGPLLICATKKSPPLSDYKLPAETVSLLRRNPHWLRPAGEALCIVDVIRCRPMVKEDERWACCELYPGAWAWELANLRRLIPFPVRGRQQMFNVDFSEEPVFSGQAARRPGPGSEL